MICQVLHRGWKLDVGSDGLPVKIQYDIDGVRT